MDGNKLLASVIIPELKLQAIEDLKNADRYVVVIWNDEYGPEGGNLSTSTNLSDTERDKIFHAIMMMDKVNSNQN